MQLEYSTVFEFSRFAKNEVLLYMYIYKRMPVIGMVHLICIIIHCTLRVSRQFYQIEYRQCIKEQ